jgi:hypothetical protein
MPIEASGNILRAAWRRPEQDCAGLDILAGAPDVGAALEAGRNRHDGPAVGRLGLDILLQDHGVMPRRHHGAGEDARGCPRRRRTLQAMARGGPAVHEQLLAGSGIVIGRGEGIAVDSRVGMGGHRPGRHRRLGQGAPRSLSQGHRLPARHRCDALLQDRQRLAMAQPLLVVAEAVVEELVGHVVRSGEPGIPDGIPAPSKANHSSREGAAAQLTPPANTSM